MEQIGNSNLKSYLGKTAKLISDNLRNSLKTETGKIMYVDTSDNSVIMEHSQGWKPAKSEVKRYGLRKEGSYTFANINQIEIID